MSREAFLRRLRRSGLIDEGVYNVLDAALPTTPRGRLVARALVAQGLLTRFQAEQLLAGRTRGFLVGPYRVLEQLGQGGMGCVFKAEHRTLGHVVALKAIAPRLLKSSRALRFFLREVKAVSRLDHPNIVKALEADQDGDRHYLVMEYVNGPNLDQFVHRHGPLPMGLACDLAAQVAEALAYAHTLGMVHRDIKPANLLVNNGPAARDLPAVVKITDFGLARLGAPQGPQAEGQGSVYGTILTRANTVMGTPDYIAPEQARDLHSADIRSDLYALGCTLYFCLTGTVPFPGGSTLEKLVRHSVEEPVSLSELRPEVPPQVRRIIRQLMAKKPEERFQTPAEVVEALAPFRAASPLPFARQETVDEAEVRATPLDLPEPSEEATSDPEDLFVGTIPPDASTTPAETSGSLSSESRPRWYENRPALRWLLLGAASVAVGLGLALLARWLIL